MRIRSRSALLSIATFVLTVTSLMCQALTKPEFPVIFIHGITGSADETWGDFKSFLVAEGWQFGGSPTYSAASKQVSSVSEGDFYTMNMSDFNSLPFKSQNLTLSEQGWEVAAVIAKVLSVNPSKAKVILTAHSMGGLAARSYLQGLAKKDGGTAAYRGDIAKLITLSTPHQGVEVAVVVRESTPAGLLIREKLSLKSDSIGLAELIPNSLALLTLNDLSKNPLPSSVSYVSIVGTGLKQLLFSDQLGDGIVSASAQNLANLAGAQVLDYTAKEIFIQPRADCDPLFDLNAVNRALLKLDTLDKGVIGHTCATTDGGVRAELIQQFRPTSLANGVGSASGPYTFVTWLAGPLSSFDGAGFLKPEGVAVDSAGNVYVADYWNHTIRKVTSAGVVTTLAGRAREFFQVDGTGSAARFYHPSGVAVDSAGNVYVAEYGNSTIRRGWPATLRPLVIIQPASQTALMTSNVTFSVKAASTTPLTYQ